MPVHWIIRGVEVQHQFFQRCIERGDEPVDQHLVNRPGGLSLGAVLQPAQGRRAGQLLIPFYRGLQGRIEPERGVVVQILVAQRDRIDSLARQAQWAVHDLGRVPVIRHRPHRRQPQPPIHLPRKQPSLVTAPPEHSASTLPPRQAGNSIRSALRFVMAKSLVLEGQATYSTRILRDFASPFHEKSGLRLPPFAPPRFSVH
jgi:hypothetical protein